MLFDVYCNSVMLVHDMNAVPNSSIWW